MRIIYSLLYILSASVYAQSPFPTQLDSFTSELLKEESEANYFIDTIQEEFPSTLVKPVYLLPQMGKYSLEEVRKLYEMSHHCHYALLNTSLQNNLIHFIRAMCFSLELPSSWFDTKDNIHPGGGTYAYRYISKYPSLKSNINKYLHVQERNLAPSDTLLGRLQRMPESGIDALYTKAKYIISDQELWVRQNSNYRVYSSDQWKYLLKEYRLTLDDISKNEYCLSRIGNVCWNSKRQKNHWNTIIYFLLVINISWLCIWGMMRWKIRQKNLKERMLILQILTHELRTPIASLSLIVEGFRRKFDDLPESFYDEFRRLCEDTRRLKQLAEASKDYLQSNQQRLQKIKIPSLKEWIESICDEQQVTCVCEQDAEISINIYWLTMSLDNLISNAKKYGSLPVVVTVKIQHYNLIIEVVDQGQLSAKHWKQIRKPFVSDKGLGLGLTIVNSMVNRMGGKITLKGPPTTFIMEIPCEPNKIITG